MTMTPDDIDKAVAQLSGLNERELIEVLTRVFDAFAVKFKAEGQADRRYALVRSSFETGEDEEPYLEFLGVPSQMYWLQSNDAAWDSGACPTCGVLVACANKLARCPVCGTTGVQCT